MMYQRLERPKVLTPVAIVMLLSHFYVWSIGYTQTPEQIRTLVQQLKSEERRIHDAAAEELVRMQDPRVVDAIVEAVRQSYSAKDRSGLFPARLGFVLKKLWQETRAVAALIGTLQFGDSSSQVEAAKNLGTIGGDGAVMALLDALEGQKDWQVKAAAARALGNIGDARAVDTLIRTMKAGTVVAAEALAQLGKPAENRLYPLMKAKDLQELATTYAYFILKGAKGTEDPLIRALKAHGNLYMAEAFLSCQNPVLEKAAKEWAAKHGYTIVGSQLTHHGGSGGLFMSTYGGGDPRLRWGRGVLLVQ